MEVLFACDERFLPHAATMLCSLLENNRVCRIHLFYNSIDGRELAKLESLVARYGSHITFYEVVPSDFEDLPVDKRYSISIYYRLLAPRLLPADVDKVLYLDSDIIIRRSLDKLWNTDITGHACAAVPDCMSEYLGLGRELGLSADTKYFNSGVLLINLRFWRRRNVPELAIFFIKNNPGHLCYWDQDALNAILANQWIEIPAYWNTQNPPMDEWPCGPTSTMGMDPAVVHFTGTVKPWHRSSVHPFKHEYHSYRLKTPWRRYRPEGLPRLLLRVGFSLRRVKRVVLPGSVRRWLRSHVVGSRV